MPSLIGTPVAANYAKTQPSSTLGTRELAFFVVDMNDEASFRGEGDEHLASDSTFSKAVRGLQLNTELFLIGEPSSNRFTVLAAKDTAPFGEGQSAGDGSRNAILSAAVSEAAGVNIDVWNAYLYDDNINWD